MAKFRSNRNSFRYPADRKTIGTFDNVYIGGAMALIWAGIWARGVVGRVCLVDRVT